MKAREITEIYRIDPADAQGLGSKDGVNSRFDYDDISQKLKPLPGGSGLTYAVVREPDDISIVIADPDNYSIVGYLDLISDTNFPMKNAHSVEMIAVDPDYRNRAIGRALYGIYLSILKYPLLAGRDQTAAGRASWLKLSQIPGVAVRGYVLFQDRWFDDDSPGFDEFIDKIMAMGGRYLGKSSGLHYFSFDVVPGTGELEPAVKKALNVYSERFDPYEITGLYAVWRGK